MSDELDLGRDRARAEAALGAHGGKRWSVDEARRANAAHVAGMDPGDATIALLDRLAAAEAEVERLKGNAASCGIHWEESESRVVAAEAERDDMRRRLDNVRALNERWRAEAQARGPGDVLITAGVVQMLDRALDAPQAERR